MAGPSAEATGALWEPPADQAAREIKNNAEEWQFLSSQRKIRPAEVAVPTRPTGQTAHAAARNRQESETPDPQ
eukprot:14242361-Alexandrium_andersonii.AAC.1